MKYKYNDYELLYLISEHNEEALEIMFQKYEPLIKARLKGFKIKAKNFDDFYQESLMVLYSCISRFSDYYGKTFTKYFDITLQRKIMDLLKESKKYFYDTAILEDLSFICEEPKINYEIFQNINMKNWSDIEKEVFKLRFVQNMPISQIAIVKNVKIKTVYNAIARIKLKIKDNNNIK